MSGSRYERVPQVEENIGLDPIDQAYNYNSGVPNSPPPSFHSSQSDVPLRSNNATPTNGPDLLGDPRLTSGSVVGSATGSEALVINLHRRIERLEETVGRLLLEKPPISSSSPSDHSNCCVTFSDSAHASASELAAIDRAGSNCCVTFRSQPPRSERQQHGIRVMKLVLVGLVLGMTWSVLLAFARRPVCANCEGPKHAA